MYSLCFFYYLKFTPTLTTAVTPTLIQLHPHSHPHTLYIMLFYLIFILCLCLNVSENKQSDRHSYTPVCMICCEMAYPAVYSRNTKVTMERIRYLVMLIMPYISIWRYSLVSRVPVSCVKFLCLGVVNDSWQINTQFFISTSFTLLI